jgi:transposase
MATAPTCYGPGVAALGTYLLARQHLPVARAGELLSDVLAVPVSSGYLASLPGRAGRLLAPFTDQVAAQIAAAPLAHFDETGARVVGKLSWVHVAATKHLTHYSLHQRRGRIGMDAAGILPTFTGISVHDGLSGYRQYPEHTHALCNAHHLRELAGIADSPNQGWASRMAALLVRWHRKVTAAAGDGRDRLAPAQLARLRRSYRKLVAEGKALNPPPARTGKRGRPKLGPALALLTRLETPRGRRPALRQRLHRPFRQQPGRTRHPDDQDPAEDLRRLANRARSHQLPGHPRLPLHSPQTPPAPPHRPQRPLHRPPLDAPTPPHLNSHPR